MKQLIGLILGSASVWSCVGAEPGGGALPFVDTKMARAMSPARPSATRRAVSGRSRPGFEGEEDDTHPKLALHGVPCRGFSIEIRRASTD